MAPRTRPRPRRAPRVRLRRPPRVRPQPPAQSLVAPPVYYTPWEAAKIVGVTPHGLRRWVEKGYLAADAYLVHHRTRLFLRSSIEAANAFVLKKSLGRPRTRIPQNVIESATSPHCCDPHAGVPPEVVRGSPGTPAPMEGIPEEVPAAVAQLEEPLRRNQEVVRSMRTRGSRPKQGLKYAKRSKIWRKAR